MIATAMRKTTEHSLAAAKESLATTEILVAYLEVELNKARNHREILSLKVIALEDTPHDLLECIVQKMLDGRFHDSHELGTTIGAAQDKIGSILSQLYENHLAEYEAGQYRLRKVFFED